VGAQLGQKLQGEFAKLAKEKTAVEKQKEQKQELMTDFQMKLLKSTKKV
jgi:hypothetical protein